MNNEKNNSNKSESVNNILFGAVLFGLIIFGIFFILVATHTIELQINNEGTADTTQNKPQTPQLLNSSEDKPLPVSESKDKITCIDVTSIDYNWDNDVQCTRPDGTKFYTDYAGGRENDPNFER